MIQQEIDYTDFEALGAKRGEMNCTTHFKKYGYDDFWIRLKVRKGFYIEWDNKTQLCECYQVDNKEDENIISRFPIQSLGHLKQVIKFLNPSKFKHL